MGEIFSILDKSITTPPQISGDYTVNLYPSEASAKVGNVVYGKCMRAAFLRYKGALGQDIQDDQGNIIVPVPDPTSPKAEWIFEAGNRFESMLIDEAKKARIHIEDHIKLSIPINNGLFIRGEVDAVFQNSKGELVGIEIKSISGYDAEQQIIGSDSMRRKGHKGNPKVEHLMQASIYAWHFRNKLRRFHLLYIMRDKCLRTEFEVEVKQDPYGVRQIFVDNKIWPLFTLDDVIDRYRALSDHITNNTLPPRDYDRIYSDQKMCALSASNSLGKTDKEAWDKYWDRIEQHNQGKKARLVKRPSVGDWPCSGYCPYVDICYKSNGLPYDKPESDYGMDTDQSDSVLPIVVEDETTPVEPDTV